MLPSIAGEASASLTFHVGGPSLIAFLHLICVLHLAVEPTPPPSPLAVGNTGAEPSTNGEDIESVRASPYKHSYSN
jgi:hypothetical protein